MRNGSKESTRGVTLAAGTGTIFQGGAVEQLLGGELKAALAAGSLGGVCV